MGVVYIAKCYNVIKYKERARFARSLLAPVLVSKHIAYFTHINLAYIASSVHTLSSALAIAKLKCACLVNEQEKVVQAISLLLTRTSYIFCRLTERN